MRAIVRGKLMPLCREKVGNPAVNYRGAKKIGGAKTRGRSVQCGTDMPKMEHIIGNTPRQARQVKGSKAAVLTLSYCIHTTNTPFKASVYAVLQQLLSQFVANLSLISCLPWFGHVGGVLVLPSKMKHIPDTCQCPT